MRALAPLSVLLALVTLAHAAEPLLVRDHDRVEATLDTASPESALVLDALEGTELTVKAKSRSPGLAPTLRLFGPDDVEIRLTGFLRQSARKARLRRLELPVTGRYTIVVATTSAHGGEVRIKVKARHPVKIKDRGTLSGGAARPRFPAFAGTDVRFKVKGRDGLDPRVETMLAPGADEVALACDSNGAGVVRGEHFSCAALGDYRLVITALDDTRGEWRSKVKLRHPAHEPRRLAAEGAPAGTFTADKLPPDDGPDQPGPGDDGGDSPSVSNGIFRVTIGILDPPPDPLPLFPGSGGGSNGRSRFETQVFTLSLENVSGAAQTVQFVAFPWHNVIVRDAVTGETVWIAYMGTLPVAPVETFAPGRRESWTVSWDIPSSGAPPAGEYEALAVIHSGDARIPVGATVRFRLE